MKHYLILIFNIAVALFSMFCSLYCLKGGKYLIAGVWMFLLVKQSKLIYTSIKNKQK